MQTRTIRGVTVNSSPPGKLRAPETTVWRIIAEQLKHAAENCPTYQRGFYATLVEAYAYAESERRKALARTPNPQRNLDFGPTRGTADGN